MTDADPEPQIDQLREHLRSEQQRLAGLRQRAEEAADRTDSLREQIIRTRLDAAVQADRVAELAETFAAHLESRANGPDRDRMLSAAASEREIAAIERRNASRLREAGAGSLRLESPIPTGPDPASPDSAGSTDAR